MGGGRRGARSQWEGDRARGGQERGQEGQGGATPIPGCQAHSAPWPPAAPGASPALRSAGRWAAVGTPGLRKGQHSPWGSNTTLTLAVWENWSCSGLQNSSKVSASVVGAGALGGLFAGAAFLHLATSSCCCRRLWGGEMWGSRARGLGGTSALSTHTPPVPFPKLLPLIALTPPGSIGGFLSEICPLFKLHAVLCSYFNFRGLSY